MEDYTLVDAVVAVVILLSAFLAFSRGFVRETLSIVGWVAAAVAGYIFAPQVEPMIREIPVISDILRNSCQLSLLAAFAVVFAAALVIVSIFTPLFSGLIQRSALGPLDQGLGFIFGFARGLLLAVVCLVVYNLAIAGGEGVPMVEDSKTKELLSDFQTQLQSQIPDDAPGWIEQQFEQFTASCNA